VLSKSSLATAVIGAVCALPIHAAESKYPTRPIRFVVGFLPGGPSDTIARVVGGKLTEGLGQPVIVENRAGAGGNVSADIVADANPDGHTILLGTGGPLVIAPIIGQKIGFDPDKDFASVSTLGGSMSILAAHPSLPASSLKDLVALAKAKPGEINYASSGVGTANHLTAELLSSMAGIKLTHVPYKGSGAALPALIGGEVKLGFGPILPAIPHVKAGRLKALGVSGLQRAPAAPDIPTIAEQGLPGFHVDSWYGVFVPSKTPKPVVTQLNKELNRILVMPDVKERLSKDGVEPRGSTPEALDAIVQNEKKVWSRVIRDANIKVQ
jgi:tripartite-type tricarboxylate transporter receptor subunit TctC